MSDMPISRIVAYDIIICIPVHGPSTVLNKTINRVNEIFKDEIDKILLYKTS